MYVYCAENPSMPGLVKIGMTLDKPSHRMAQLSGHTAVPTAFICSWYAFSSNPERDEKRLHLALAAYRVSDRREFFRCTAGYARSTAESIGFRVAASSVKTTNIHVAGYLKSECISGLVAFLCAAILFFPIMNSEYGFIIRAAIIFGTIISVYFGLTIFFAIKSYKL